MADRNAEEKIRLERNARMHLALEQDKHNKKKAVEKDHQQKTIVYFGNVNAAINVLIKRLLNLGFQRRRADALAAYYGRYLKNRKARRHVSRDDEEDHARKTDQSKKTDKEKEPEPLLIAKEFGEAIENLILVQSEGTLPSEGLLEVVSFLQKAGRSLVKTLTDTLTSIVVPLLAPEITLINTSIQFINKNLESLARLEAKILKQQPAEKQKTGEVLFSRALAQKRGAVDALEEERPAKRPRPGPGSP